MNIDIAIVSSDSNPFYLDFWNPVSKIWKLKFNVKPILVYIDNVDVQISNEFGEIIRIKPVLGIPISVQNQIVRFWIPIMFPDKVCIISDIDMFPISFNYFKRSISDLGDNEYAHLNPCIDTYGRLPACYHVAKGSVLKEIFDLDLIWEDYLNKVLNFSFSQTKIEFSWDSDELFSSSKVLNYKGNIKINLIERQNGQNGYRIDRSNWYYSALLLKYDYYFDAHSIRPFNEHSNELSNFMNVVINANLRYPSKILINVSLFRRRLIDKFKYIYFIILIRMK
jgi:hypothetical protein